MELTMSDIYISGEQGMFAGPPPSVTSPCRTEVPSTEELRSIEGRLKWMAKLPYYSDRDKLNHKFNAFNDCVIEPMLADLTNQTGLLHRTDLWKTGSLNSIEQISLYRKIQNTHTFFNWLARMFCITEEVLNVTNNGQMWCVSYMRPQYYMVAEQIKEIYYSKMKDAFDGQDMVIVSK
jgi:hypothetical protein